MRELISLLEEQIGESDTVKSVVGQQRERNHRYYSMQPLGNEVKGRSHYIDPSVFSAVEDKKAVYDETFLTTRQVARFNGPNHAEAKAKGAYVQTILKRNNYTEIFKNGWHNAFVAKRMTVWLDWRRDRKEVTLNLRGTPSRVINQQLAQLGNIVSVNRDNVQSNPIPSIGQQQFVHTGPLTVEIDSSYLHLDLIQPEFVLRDPNQAYARDSMWNAARMDMSRLMLKDWGFDPEQVDKLKPEYRWGTSEEAQARVAHDSTTVTSTHLSSKREQSLCTVYKTRAWLVPDDFKGMEFEPETDGAGIYEIYWGHGEVLRWNDGELAIRPMPEMDVFEWTEFKIAHAESGLSTADVEVHQQKAQSGLKRGVMDYMNICNNPRWEADTSNLLDYRDLTDNVIGGIIETDNKPVGNIKALEVPQLSPLVFGVMQMLDRDSESRSGMSDLARGMNQGAINNQNADSMIERLTTAGARRTAMGVRSFANDFYIPLLQGIVRCGMRYDKSQTTMESGGNQLVIAPSQWQDNEHEMEIEVALTPEEAMEMSGRLLMMDGRLREDEDLKPLYGLKQKHALYDTMFELMGIKDSTQFMASPESPEFRQMAMQRMQQAQQAKMKQDQMMMFQMGLAENEQTRKWQELNNKILDTIHDNELEDEKLEQEHFFRSEELRLEEQQERAVAS